MTSLTPSLKSEGLLRGGGRGQGLFLKQHSTRTLLLSVSLERAERYFAHDVWKPFFSFLNSRLHLQTPPAKGNRRWLFTRARVDEGDGAWRSRPPGCLQPLDMRQQAEETPACGRSPFRNRLPNFRILSFASATGAGLSLLSKASLSGGSFPFTLTGESYLRFLFFMKVLRLRLNFNLNEDAAQYLWIKSETPNSSFFHP